MALPDLGHAIAFTTFACCLLLNTVVCDFVLLCAIVAYCRSTFLMFTFMNLCARLMSFTVNKKRHMRVSIFAFLPSPLGRVKVRVVIRAVEKAHQKLPSLACAIAFTVLLLTFVLVHSFVTLCTCTLLSCTSVTTGASAGLHPGR